MSRAGFACASALALFTWLATGCSGDTLVGEHDGSTSNDAGESADASVRDATVDAAVMDASVVKCGSATCPAFPDTGSLTATPCCYAAATSTCSGIVEPLPFATCNRPAVDDVRCPGVVVQAYAVSGCCAESGYCGLNGNALGLGCLDLSNMDVRFAVEPTLDGGALPPITACASPDSGTP